MGDSYRLAFCLSEVELFVLIQVCRHARYNATDLNYFKLSMMQVFMLILMVRMLRISASVQLKWRASLRSRRSVCVCWGGGGKAKC